MWKHKGDQWEGVKETKAVLTKASSLPESLDVMSLILLLQ